MLKRSIIVFQLAVALLIGLIGLSGCSPERVEFSDGSSVALVEYNVPADMRGISVLLVLYGFPEEDAKASQYLTELTGEPAFHGTNEGVGVYVSRMLRMPKKIKLPARRVEFVYYIEQRKSVLRRYSADNGYDLGFSANQFFYDSMYWDQ